MTRRIPPDFKLTDREKDLVRLANIDPGMKPDGFFRIDDDTFQCDMCDSRLPHNAKQDRDQHVTDMYITKDEGTICRLCAEEQPWSMERDEEPPFDTEPGRGNQ